MKINDLFETFLKSITESKPVLLPLPTVAATSLITHLWFVTSQQRLGQAGDKVGMGDTLLFLDCPKWIMFRSPSLKLCYVGATLRIWVSVVQLTDTFFSLDPYK